MKTLQTTLAFAVTFAIVQMGSLCAGTKSSPGVVRGVKWPKKAK